MTTLTRFSKFFDVYYNTQLIVNGTPRIKLEITTTITGNAAFQYKFYSDASFTQFTSETGFTPIVNGYNIFQLDNPSQLYAIGRLSLVPESSVVISSLKINDIENIITGTISITNAQSITVSGFDDISNKIVDLYYKNQIIVQGTPRIKLEITATVTGNAAFQYNFYSDASFTQFTSNIAFFPILNGYNILQLDNPPQLYAIGRLSLVPESTLSISSLKINDVEHITTGNLFINTPLLTGSGFGDGFCTFSDFYYNTQLIVNGTPLIKLEITTTLVGNAAFQYNFYSDASFTQFTRKTGFTSITNGYNIIQLDNPSQLYAIGRLSLVPGSILSISSLKINEVEHITTGNFFIDSPAVTFTKSINNNVYYASTKLYKISDPSFNVVFNIQNLSGTAYFEYIYYTDETYTTISYTTTTAVYNGTTVLNIAYVNQFVLIQFKLDFNSSIQVTSFKLKEVEQLSSTTTIGIKNNTIQTLFTTSLNDLANKLLTPLSLTYGIANTGIINLGSALTSVNLLGPAYGTTASLTDNSSTLATTAFVKGQGYSTGSGSTVGYAQTAVAQTWSALQTFSTGIQSSAYNALTATSTISLGANLTTGILNLGTSTSTIQLNAPLTPTYSSRPTSTQIGYNVHLPGLLSTNFVFNGRYRVFRYVPVVQGTYMATAHGCPQLNLDYFMMWFGALKVTPTDGLDITDFAFNTDHIVFNPSLTASANSTNTFLANTVWSVSGTMYIPAGYTSLILGTSVLKAGNPTSNMYTSLTVTRIA